MPMRMDRFSEACSMPVQDSTEITAGMFDDVHAVWITRLRSHVRDCNVLRSGVALPFLCQPFRYGAVEVSF
jgi:hypothetical protein